MNSRLRSHRESPTQPYRCEFHFHINSYSISKKKNVAHVTTFGQCYRSGINGGSTPSGLQRAACSLTTWHCSSKHRHGHPHGKNPLTSFRLVLLCFKIPMSVTWWFIFWCKVSPLSKAASYEVSRNPFSRLFHSLALQSARRFLQVKCPAPDQLPVANANGTRHVTHLLIQR